MKENRNNKIEKDSFFDKDKKAKIVLAFLIIVVIIILWLLFQRFTIAFMGNNITQVSTGNIDIFEINCNDNCSCSENKQPNQIINKLNNDSFLSNIFISQGTLKFDSKINSYNVLVENHIDKITLNATRNNNKATLFYIYNKKIYSSFNDVFISIGENVITIVVIAENGDLTSYRVVVSRLDNKGEVVPPLIKNTNNNLTNITISNGSLVFEKGKTDYTVLLDDEIEKITLIAIKESEKSTVSYVYNGKNYNEFNDIKLSFENNIVTIIVTAEDGSVMKYTVTVKKPSSLDSLDDLGWYTHNNLNIFSNPAYKGEAIIAPGSENSYEFIIRNKVNKKVKYKLEFDETSEQKINMKYRLKRNGEYLIGNENTWVSYSELNTRELEVNYNKADDYILDWKWFDGENDNLIGKLQNDYTLSITLSAITTV